MRSHPILPPPHHHKKRKRQTKRYSKDQIERLTNMNTTSFFYLPFRWVEDKKVSNRIIKIWPSIVKIVNHWSLLSPSKQPKCKSYEVLKNAVLPLLPNLISSVFLMGVSSHI